MVMYTLVVGLMETRILEQFLNLHGIPMTVLLLELLTMGIGLG